MLKKILAIFLLFALLSSNFSSYFIIAGFDINQKYIAEKFCINKNRPWMHCNGRCYLMRKLKQAEENERKQERENQRNRFQEAIVASPVVFRFQKTVHEIHYAALPVYATIGRSSAIFRPPKPQ